MPIKFKRKVKKTKRFHFIGRWRNGDPMNVSVEGKDKKDAWFRLLKAKKDKKFEYNKGDNFSVTFDTVEEKNKKGFSLAGGHCFYTVDEKGNIETN